VALELQYLAESLLGRINLHMGYRMVQQLRFVQDMQEKVLPMQVSRHAPVGTSPANEAALEGIPAGPLRDALASLGRAVLRHRAP
jgi:hypothetical protein